MLNLCLTPLEQARQSIRNLWYIESTQVNALHVLFALCLFTCLAKIIFLLRLQFGQPNINKYLTGALGVDSIFLEVCGTEVRRGFCSYIFFLKPIIKRKKGLKWENRYLPIFCCSQINSTKHGPVYKFGACNSRR